MPVFAFVSLVLLHSDLPGIYMDGVNPDFMAAQWLHRGHNPGAGIPSKIFPILGSFYHGLQNAYLGVPLFAIGGFSVTSLRLEQAVFGVILLVALSHLARRLTGSLGWALLAAMGLATELAFTASFRTQFYIVVGGAAWLFVSMLLALPADEQSRIVRRRVFWSGFFFGLASYGYFVLAFFAPAMVLLVAISTPRRQWGSWIIGAAVGVSPFLLGFLSLLAKKHGIEPTLEFVRGMLGQLKPFDAGDVTGSRAQYVWELIRLATSDAANEEMIFGEPTSGKWVQAKAWVLVASVLFLLVCAGINLARKDERLVKALPVLMPLSFVAIASLFGHRLWAHHFSVLVPFVYLLLALSLHRLSAAFDLSGRREQAIVGVLVAALVAGNLAQQANFHEKLVATGGRGHSTDVLTQLGVEARQAPENVAYVFPEWGFFTSFCFLTGNRVRYVIDAEPKTIARLQREGITEIRLVYWDAGSESSYDHVLRDAGAIPTDHRAFVSREQRAVFHWIRATLSPPPSAP
ncbi:hypothetical protein C8J98_103223 [Luteibacter sp. OK325]|nr:hypothetical protein C8J98_103223 [Luteibacter sp. OK325]